MTTQIAIYGSDPFGVAPAALIVLLTDPGHARDHRRRRDGLTGRLEPRTHRPRPDHDPDRGLRVHGSRGATFDQLPRNVAAVKPRLPTTDR